LLPLLSALVTPGLLLPPLLSTGDCFFITKNHFAVALAVAADYAVANMALMLPLLPTLVAAAVFVAAGALSPLS